jgi:hypothetical protein
MAAEGHRQESIPIGLLTTFLGNNMQYVVQEFLIEHLNRQQTKKMWIKSANIVWDYG